MSSPASTRCKPTGAETAALGAGRGAGRHLHRRPSPDPSAAAPPLQAPPKVTPPPTSADLPKGSQGCSQPQPGGVRAKNRGIFPKPCPRAVQYLSGGVRRECAGRWPSRTSPAALRGPRVLSPHRLLGAAIFFPRPVRERGFRCVTSGVGRGSQGLRSETRGLGPARDRRTEGRRPEGFRETRGARGAAAPGRDRSGRRARASAPRLAGVLGPRRESEATGRAGCRMPAGGSEVLWDSCWCPNRQEAVVLGTTLPPSNLIAVPAVLCSLSGGRTDVLQVACSWHTPGTAAVRASSNEAGAPRGSDLGPWSEICTGVLAPPPDLDLPGLIARVLWT